MVLEDCKKLLVFDKIYAEDPVGLYILRGDNIVLLGCIVRPSLVLQLDLTDIRRTILR